MRTHSAVLLRLLTPYRWLAAAILAAMLIASLLEGLGVAAFLPLLHALVGGGNSFGGPLSALFRWVPTGLWGGPLLSALVLLFGINLLRCLATLLRDGSVAYASGTLQRDLKQRLMDRFADSPYPFFLDQKQGQLIYLLSTAATRVGVLAQKLPQLASEFLKASVLLILLLMVLPLETISLLGIGLIYHRLTHWVSTRISYHTGQGRMKAAADQLSITSEFLGGIRQILAFGTEASWRRRFALPNELYRRLYIRDGIWLSVPRVLLELSFIGVLVVLIGVAQSRASGTLLEQLPRMGVFVMGLLRLLPSLTSLGQLRMELSSLLPDAEQVEKALEAPTRSPVTGSRVLTTVQKGIRLKGVDFSYPGRPELFKGLDLEFEAGRVTALVGPSGGGKTTLALMLLGLVDPVEGKIWVDDIPLRDLELNAWRKRIGFVSQDQFLFHASVRENILFGREGFPQEAVEAAARLANAHEFIQELPEGYNTVIGERGMKLSGGQQQRLAIARAVLHNPDLLLLDEATSHLDSEVERQVRDAIRRVSKGRTVILIAHRLSTVQDADRVIVLEGGRVVEAGSPRELLEAGGRYSQLAEAAR